MGAEWKDETTHEGATEADPPGPAEKTSVWASRPQGTAQPQQGRVQEAARAEQTGAVGMRSEGQEAPPSEPAASKSWSSGAGAQGGPPIAALGKTSERTKATALAVLSHLAQRLS